jgi:hypothetical protein
MALGIVLGVAGVFPVTVITFDLDRACASRLRRTSSAAW